MRYDFDSCRFRSVKTPVLAYIARTGVNLFNNTSPKSIETIQLIAQIPAHTTVWQGGLDPFQSALFPYPDVSDDEDAEKHEHLNESKDAQVFVLHRPRE